MSLKEDYVIYRGVDPPSLIPKTFFHDPLTAKLIRKRLQAPNLGKIQQKLTKDVMNI